MNGCASPLIAFLIVIVAGLLFALFPFFLILIAIPSTFPACLATFTGTWQRLLRLCTRPRQSALTSLCLRLVRLAATSVVVLAVVGLTLEFAALRLAHPLKYLQPQTRRQLLCSTDRTPRKLLRSADARQLPPSAAPIARLRRATLAPPFDSPDAGPPFESKGGACACQSCARAQRTIIEPFATHRFSHLCTPSSFCMYFSFAIQVFDAMMASDGAA